MKQQQGFTLVELVIVIVILGILAAVAVPKFVDLKGDAAQAAVDSVAGSISSASATNYATYQVNPSKAERLNGATPCDTLVKSAKTGLIGGLPNGIAITADTTCASVAAGESVACTVTNSASTPAMTADAFVICTN